MHVIPTFALPFTGNRCIAFVDDLGDSSITQILTEVKGHFHFKEETFKEYGLWVDLIGNGFWLEESKTAADYKLKGEVILDSMTLTH
jgi:hypothetical protein